MYRWIVPILLCITVHSAPQDSDITYVKIQPLNTDPEPVREPREDQGTEEPGNPTTVQITTNKLDLTTVDPISESIDPSIINKLNRISTDDPSRPFTHQTVNKTNDNSYRFARSDVTTFETTTGEIQTEKEEEKPQTTKFESRTRTPLRYLSKLGYFKSTASYGGSDVNLLERGGKRRFRSKCRCEKIWNCPKLQITVPRCPNEYFLCC